MNTPLPDQQEIADDQSQPQVHLLPVGIAAIVMLVLLIGGLIFAILFEQQQRTEEKVAALASPTLLPQQSQIPTPTLQPTYQPQVPGMNKQKALELFNAVTFERDIYRADKHLVRWESERIPWRLRGQFTTEDRQCFTSIAKKFNSAMKTAQLEETTTESTSYRNNGLEIYVLPRDQFSSVNPDIRPDQPGQLFYTRSGYSLSDVDILIDLNQPIGFRCLQLHDLITQAVGLAFSINDESLTGPIASPSFIYNARYSASDLEMLRILYSPLLTAGLTQAEVERRLQQ